MNNDGDREEGDCSLRVKEANIDYDNGVWQCQVTASDFTQRDTLISEGAELIVRGKRYLYVVQFYTRRGQSLSVDTS